MAIMAFMAWQWHCKGTATAWQRHGDSIGFQATSWVILKKINKVFENFDKHQQNSRAHPGAKV